MKGDVKLRLPIYITHLTSKYDVMMHIEFPLGSKYEGLTAFVLRNKTKEICEMIGNTMYCYVDVILNPDLTTSLVDYRGLQPKYIKTISHAEVIEELSAYVCE